MSQDQVNKNSEYETEVESEYEESESGSDYEDSESDDGDNNNNGNATKRRRIDDNSTEVLLTDDKGHIKCLPGQQLGSYEIVSVLGEGAYGRVLRAKNIKTGQSAALKVTKNEQSKRKTAMGEIIALTIIQCRDSSDTSLCIKMQNWFSYAGHVCIAFPLLGGSVFDFIQNNNYEPFSINEVRHISYQLCCAVSFLHKNGMTHTDLKPENILFVNSSYTTVYDDNRKSNLRRINCTDIRLIDFGGVTRDGDYHHSIVSTRYYRAPEVILKLDWTHSCDVWSIGCIMVELYVGDLLFPSEADHEHLAMMEIILGQMPAQMVDASSTNYFKNGKLDWNWNEAEEGAEEHCSPLNEFLLADCEEDHEMFRVIEQMLQCNPKKRIPLNIGLVHPFFEKLPSHQRANKLRRTK